MKRTFLMSGALLGLFGIILGAYAAHGLEKIADLDAVDSFETGVRYQMYHAFFFLFMGIWDGLARTAQKILFWIIWVGLIFFSGTIYLLVMGKVWSMNLSFLGPVTPLGGLLLISGWVFLGYHILTQKSVK
ncbi:MAG: DUF423 domain-containing protein [Bacteroidota bacterium]